MNWESSISISYSCQISELQQWNNIIKNDFNGGVLHLWRFGRFAFLEVAVLAAYRPGFLTVLSQSGSSSPFITHSLLGEKGKLSGKSIWSFLANKPLLWMDEKKKWIERLLLHPVESISCKHVKSGDFNSSPYGGGFWRAWLVEWGTGNGMVDWRGGWIEWRTGRGREGNRRGHLTSAREHRWKATVAKHKDESVLSLTRPKPAKHPRPVYFFITYIKSSLCSSPYIVTKWAHLLHLSCPFHCFLTSRMTLWSPGAESSLAYLFLLLWILWLSLVFHVL